MTKCEHHDAALARVLADMSAATTQMEQDRLMIILTDLLVYGKCEGCA